MKRSWCAVTIHLIDTWSQHHLSGSGIAPLEFYHCWEPVRNSAHDKVMRKEARHTQRRDRASGVPLEILEHIPPKPESAYFLLVLKEPTHWKRPWCWERLRARGEGDDRGWDGWIHTMMTQYYISRNSASQDCGWPTKLLRFPQEGKHQPQPWEMLQQSLKLDQGLHWSRESGAQRREMSILPTSPGVGPLATPGSSQSPGSHPTWYLFLFPPKVSGVWTQLPETPEYLVRLPGWLLPLIIKCCLNSWSLLL